jgi:arylsulfatase A-like enzyme
MRFDNLPEKPNILLIITDQEREVMHWPDGWAEENLRARSRLMANGLTFRNANCVTATCSPSRASLMTGLYPAQHGVKSLIFCDDPNEKWQRSRAQLSPDIPNIATIMGEAGYHVVLKGKFHLSRPVSYDGERQRHYWSNADIPFMEERYGFHEWNPPDMSDPIGTTDYGGGSINNDGRFVDGTGTAAGKPMPEDTQFRQSAVHFLNNYDGDKPFCLIVSLVNPHDVQGYPGRGTQNLLRRKPTYEQAGYKLEEFEELPIDLPPTVDEDLSTKPSAHRAIRRVIDIGLGHMRSRTRQRNYARFYAYLCREVDKQVGKVLDALDANGLTENTLIIRTSDHGELGMAHGKMREKFYNTYRESLSVPLIFSNPHLFPEPQITDSFASLIDILPTLTAIADLPDPERFRFQGRDLTPILANPSSEVQDYIHFTYEEDQFPLRGAANCIRAIVEKDWKYAVYYDPFQGAPVEYEMYHLKNDPYETTNLAHPDHYLPAYAAIPASKVAEERRRLHNRLLEVMQTHGTTPPEVQFPTTEAFEQAYEVPQEVYHDPIHSGIKQRQRIYAVIAALTSLAALYQLIFREPRLLPTVAVFTAGVLLGLFFFSRINKLSWDNEQGQIVAGTDLASIMILLVYVGFIILGDTPLLQRIIEGGTIDAASFSLIAGIALGQIRGMRARIRDILGPDESSQRAYISQIDIDAPAEQVWSVVTDFESYKSWNPLLSEVEGELVVGGDLRVHAAFAPVPVPATVTVVDKPNRFEWEDHVPLNLLTPTFSVQLLPLPENRTRVIIAETFTGPLLPLLGRRLDKQMPPLYDAMAEALAQQVEGNKTVS